MRFLMRIFKLNIRSQKGFSLAELMVAVSVAGLTTVSVANVYVNGQRSYIYLQGNSKNMQIARSNIDVLSKEIRTTIDIESAYDDSLSVSADFDGDGNTETINYYYDSAYGYIARSTGGATKNLGEGIINSAEQPVFQYYDQDGNLITDQGQYNQAKMMKINLYVDNDPNSVPNRPINVSTNIQLRNLHERR